MYLVQDQKIFKKERAKIDDKWKALSRQAQNKNPNYREPISKLLLNLKLNLK